MEASSHWEGRNEDLLTNNSWVNDIDRNDRASSLLMLNDNRLQNQSTSPTSSESSKGEEVRADSVMTNLSSNEANFRRYAKINDSEFDWNALNHKRIKAMEYRRDLTLQHEEKMRRKREEIIKRKEEEERLEKKLEEQRIRMRDELEREQRLIEDKKIIAEKKREAVIAAIEKTPIIKRRNFLVESSNDCQPVVAIRPQTRSQDTSAQTETQDIQYCEIGTQTDVQLLLQLFDDLNVASKQKSKSLSKLEDVAQTKNQPGKTSTTMSQRKNNYRTEIHLDKRNKKVARRSQWVNPDLGKPNLVVNKKSRTESIKNDNKGNYNKLKEVEPKENLKEEKKDLEVKIVSQDKAFRRNSLNISQSSENLSNLKTHRIKSSIEAINRPKFLPDISGRPHSRKKWYSQERFDPNYLS